MSYPNSYSSCDSCDSPIFLDPWPENHQSYLDTNLNDLESMLDDSAETVVFPSHDSSLHPQEPDSTTTNHPLLLYNIWSKKLQVLLFFEKFTLHFSLALGTFSLTVEIGSLLLSHVLLKHNKRIIVDTTVSFVCDAYFCIFLNAASCRKLVTDTAST